MRAGETRTKHYLTTNVQTPFIYIYQVNQQLTKYGVNQLRDYSSIFLRRTAESLLKGDNMPLDLKIDRYDHSWRNRKGVTYLDYVKHIYSIVEENYQNEYVLKNSFLNKSLLKELGNTNSRVFSEFRIGNSIADLVMFNGVSKAFEIKTEFDSVNRLPMQLRDYEKVFNEVYLIVPESKLQFYEMHSESAGIIAFNGAKQKFSVFKNPVRNKVVCPTTIQHALRVNEYKAIVLDYYGELPQMTSFTQFETCLSLIKLIPNELLNTLFIKQMKSRPSNSSLSYRYYRELNQLMLALKLTKSKRQQLIDNLCMPITH